MCPFASRRIQPEGPPFSLPSTMCREAAIALRALLRHSHKNRQSLTGPCAHVGAMGQSLASASNDRNISRNHRNISRNHRNISRNHRNISQNHRNISRNHRNISQNHRNISRNHRNISQNHRNVFWKHRNVFWKHRKGVKACSCEPVPRGRQCACSAATFPVTTDIWDLEPAKILRVAVSRRRLSAPIAFYKQPFGSPRPSAILVDSHRQHFHTRGLCRLTYAAISDLRANTVPTPFATLLPRGTPCVQTEIHSAASGP